MKVNIILYPVLIEKRIISIHKLSAHYIDIFGFPSKFERALIRIDHAKLIKSIFNGIFVTVYYIHISILLIL